MYSKSMKRGDSHFHLWIAVALVLGATFLASTGVVTPTGAVVYRDAGYGYGGSSGGLFFDSFGDVQFLDLYYQYGGIIDAVLFLIIFLSVGRGVFEEQFKKGGKTLYMGVGIFLALALVLWEEQSGFHILTHAGPVALAILGLTLLVGMFLFLHKGGFRPVMAVLLIYLILYFTVLWPQFSGSEYGSLGSWLQSAMFASLFGLLIAMLLGWVHRGDTGSRRERMRPW